MNRKTVKKAIEPRELPTAERMAKGDMHIEGTERKLHFKAMNWPLDRYHKRGEITDDQHRAGARIFRDWSLSHAHKGQGALWEGHRGRPHTTDTPLSHFENCRRALEALTDKSRRLVERVAIEGYSLPAIHAELQFSPRNTGMDRLREALDDLHEYYDRLYRVKSPLATSVTSR